MPRRLSVLLPTILGCCVIICLFTAVFLNLYISLIPLFIAGSLLGSLTLIYFFYQPPWIFAILILTALLIAMILAHPIKLSRWSAIVTVIGIFIWMVIGFSGFVTILSYRAT
jgi:hypothetical protein